MPKQTSSTILTLPSPTAPAAAHKRRGDELDAVEQKLWEDGKAARGEFPKAGQSAKDIAQAVGDLRLQTLANKVTGEMFAGNGDKGADRGGALVGRDADPGGVRNRYGAFSQAPAISGATAAAPVMQPPRKRGRAAEARAFATLIDLKADADPNCIACHTVGFGTPSGYRREFGERSSRPWAARAVTGRAASV